MTTTYEPTTDSTPHSVSVQPVVPIYVRRSGDLSRTIAFKIPVGIDPLDILDTGFALDGNQAIFTIAWVSTGYQETDYESREAGYFDTPFGKQGHTLTDALNVAQRELVAYLRERGFIPEFA